MASKLRDSGPGQRTRVFSARAAVVGGVAGAAIGLGAVTASASHTEITANDVEYTALPVAGGDSYNGYRVYLASPRHASSGSRGELGWDENINGRHWGNYAASSSYYFGTSAPTNRLRNLNSRGYKVRLSGNSDNAADGDWATNRTNGNNFGADVYIVTHTNANDTDSNTPPGDYVLTMWRNDANSIDLSADVLAWANLAVPAGGTNSWDVAGIAGEINSQNEANHVTYLELFFHNNQCHVNWFEGGGGSGLGVKYASVIGTALDGHLNYP